MRRRGVSIADIAREAIDEHVPPARPEGGLSFFAIGEGGPADASERVDEIVGDGELVVEPVIERDWARIEELTEQYLDLPLGVVDASVIALAERHRVATIATLDRRHFGTVKPATRERVRAGALKNGGPPAWRPSAQSSTTTLPILG